MNALNRSTEPDRGDPAAPPEERSATALAILDAADAVLAEVGFEGLSARAVASRAGVNNALVFYYFGSKAGLVDRVLARYYRRHLAALELAMAGGGSLRDRMHRLIDAYVAFIEANRRYPRLVQHQLAGSGAFRQRIQDNLAPLFVWTRDALGALAPEIGPSGARHLFVTISAAVTHYYTYAEVLAPLWGSDPLDAAALSERREHLRWVVDALVSQLERDAECPRAALRPSSPS